MMGAGDHHRLKYFTHSRQNSLASVNYPLNAKKKRMRKGSIRLVDSVIESGLNQNDYQDSL
jgi:hypothetical protein